MYFFVVLIFLCTNIRYLAIDSPLVTVALVMITIFKHPFSRPAVDNIPPPAHLHSAGFHCQQGGYSIYWPECHFVQKGTTRPKWLTRLQVLLYTVFTCFYSSSVMPCDVLSILALPNYRPSKIM